MDDEFFEMFDDILLPIDENIPYEYYDNFFKEFEKSIGEDTDDEDSIDYNILISSLIKDMAQKILVQEDIEKISKKLYALYDKEIRNNYFILFSTIAEISRGSIESFDALNANIDNLNDYAKRIYKGKEKVIMGFEKLNQYVKLESNRASYNQAQIQKLGLATEQFQEQKSDLENMAERLKEYEKKLSDAESGYINNLLSVLGVFSGIIIAFFGGLEYITSVFNNIGDISKYRLVFVTLLVGFVVFNIVSVMLVFLGKMIDKDIYRPCKTENCTCAKKCNFLKRMRNKLPYIYYVNFFVLSMLIGTYVIWIIDNIIYSLL